MSAADAEAHDHWLAERPDPDPDPAAHLDDDGWDYGPGCSPRGCRLHGAGECNEDPWGATTETRNA